MDLDTYFSNAQFVHQTKLQLIKDFNQHGFQLEQLLLVEDLPLEKLFSIMAEVAQDIYQNHRQKWMALMYTIDISEREYVRIMQAEDWSKIAFFIVRREALKIYIRTHFSQ